MRIENIFFEKYFSNEFPPYFIELNNIKIGFIGCKTIEKNKNDIGIIIFKKYHGLGIGSFALKKFLELIGQNYKNKIIISQILKENAGSLNIFLKNNFKINEKKNNRRYFLYRIYFIKNISKIIYK